MTEVTAPVTDLRFTGDVPPAAELAGRARRGGVWFYAETTLLHMRWYWSSLLVVDWLQPLLWLLAMGVGLGALLDRSGQLVDGVDYLTFLGPALLVSLATQTAAGEMSYPVLGGFKWNRTYYASLATPVSPAQIATGHLVAVMIRFAVHSTVFWGYLLLFGVARTPWSVLVIPVGVLSASAFGAPLQAYSATVKEEGFQFAFIQRFIVMPMFLFAGTFFELGTMPVYLQWIGWVSPVWHGTELARAVTYGHEVSPLVALGHVAYLLAFVVAGALLSRRFYTRRLVD